MDVLRDIRSIPTCVGQPCRYSGVSYCDKVYPHVCGAAVKPAWDGVVAGGLSPRVWGSHPMCHRCATSCGSIPTCVGQPRRNSGREATMKVYPHVCGAATEPRENGLPARGLSPRVWGSLWFGCFACRPAGSIPTCVGQPSTSADAACAPSVYPHVCGAAHAMWIVIGSVMGLSPRVWGSPITGLYDGLALRSIPTCVGQPLSAAAKK